MANNRGDHIRRGFASLLLPRISDLNASVKHIRTVLLDELGKQVKEKVRPANESEAEIRWDDVSIVQKLATILR